MPIRTHLLALAVSAAATAALCVPASAQDTRTVTEPVFPPVCTQVQADLALAAGEPSSELNTAQDTTLIQTALRNCAPGSAVELIPSAGNNAFVIAPIYIPAGVTLLVDGGVTLFGSRNATDYQVTGSSATCGSTDGGAGCFPLITVGQSAVNGNTSTYFSATQPITGIMGYGIINGRGNDKLITLDNQANPTTYTVGASSFWDTAVGGNEDAPVLILAPRIANVTFYKITLLNSPHFHVRITGQGNLSASRYQTNFTAWGIKLITPWTPHNTDGIDPTGANNVSILNSIIGDGDDEIAISGSSIAQNFTFANLLMTSGHGLSIGSITTNSVSNVAVSNINFSGQAADGNQIALRIKSYCGVGGAVNNVAYNGVCVRNTTTGIDLDPFYSSTSATTNCPVYGNTAPISYANLYFNTANPRINLQGLNAASASIATLNNVYVNSPALNLVRVQSSDTAASPSNDNITLGGSYYPAPWGTLANSTNNVTETVNGTLAAAFPTAYCANAFPLLNGELYANTTAAGVTTPNVNRAATLTLPATVTLNAMLQPVNSTASFGAYTGVPAPTASVQFLDGATVVGTAALAANGTLASVVITNPTAGTHTYTANYVGDTTYTATPFGTSTYTGTQNGPVPAPTPLVITVSAGPATQLGFTAPPPAALTYGAPQASLQVAVQDVAADTVSTSSAAITLAVSGPGGYSQTYTAIAANGIATFTLNAQTPATGNVFFIATSDGLTSASAAQTVTPAVLSVTAASPSRLFDTPNALTATLTGFVNGDAATVVAGAPALTTPAAPDSPAAQYPIAVAQGTLAAANYTFSPIPGTLTITGSAPQQILFNPLPNFPSGAAYQLTARTTSGDPVTYSVQSGNATLNGATLTVSAPGPITLTANSPGDQNYAPARPVQQSFTAQ